MPFDWRQPDYAPIFRQRAERLARIRSGELRLSALHAFYRDHPADFINDWGCTVDPRNLELNIPAFIPFLLFPKQREWIDWVVRKWRKREPGLTEKSRDGGISWLAVGLSCTLCLHYDDMNIGFGSRKEEYVDQIDAPKSLFWKARRFMEGLPNEFRGGWDSSCAPHMRIKFPSTRSVMTGEAGDNIGRGDRTSLYFVDEAAHLERPKLIDAALATTTNCRMDVSSVNGMANSFAERRHGGKIEVFIWDWRDDPRKDDAWYQKQVDELDPVILAQEVNRDYSASVEGVIIPSLWVRSAVDAHIKLKFSPTGAKFGALDVADEGADLNAFCGGHGVVVQILEEWHGKNSDIFASVEKAFDICDQWGYERFRYDADGVGAGVKGDARIVNERRLKRGVRRLEVIPFRGSAGVHAPESEDVKERKNIDFFSNLKAQSWWALRGRFQKTHRAVTEGMSFNPDELISISSSCGKWQKLITELSQPTFTKSVLGKIVVDKKPDGTRSPNLADACMMRFANIGTALSISDDVLRRAAIARGRK